MIRIYTFIILAVVLIANTGMSQLQRTGWSNGVGIGAVFGETEIRDRAANYYARTFVRYGFSNQLQAEVGISLAEVQGEDYLTRIVPLDLRLVFSPFDFEVWNPFIYGGAGLLNFKVKHAPSYADPTLKQDGWTGYLPVGGGVQVQLNDLAVLEMSGGYNYTFSDNLNAVKYDRKDAYWGFLFGITASGESGDADLDKDGLTNREEKELKTDPKNPDSDNDGLNDGDEVKKYKTDPLNNDTDNDGLKDGEEVNKYKTDPTNADTDGDGLKDGEEILKYHTDPLKADSDNDGLNDKDEIMLYKTDPTISDTDADGLKDGEEVTRYKTNPLNVDTDGGSVSDGKEIANNTNPLDPVDDVPKKKEEIKVEVGKAIVLEGIVFKTGSAEISPESDAILTIAFNTLEQNPEIEVEIQGHTDNSGKRISNMKLSQRRAEAVKANLVSRGIAPTRISTKGFGPDKPIAPNTTPEGKQKNRRIEFFRMK
ncbi:MAG: OmpA family protein [Ignavibacteriales bacterium]|nr:OmpA family protein [Ignavibacteriales bacterium]